MLNSEHEQVDRGAGRESWLRLSEGLIAGVHHALNNRMGALSAVAQVIDADLAHDHPLRGALGGELQRLEGVAALLGLLVEADGAEPVQVEAIVDQARQLVEMHHSLRDLSLDLDLAAGLHPLWIDPSALLRAVMVLLGAAGARARRGGSIRLAARGDERLVELIVEASGVPDEGDAEGDLDEIDPMEAGGLLEEWGGQISVEEAAGRFHFRITLRTLAEARRREGTAAS